jgi:hypothetical protein
MPGKNKLNTGENIPVLRLFVTGSLAATFGWPETGRIIFW